MSKLKLLHVEFLPSDLEEDILYVSKKYKVAGHLCPCGCRSKIITPLGPTEWKYKERKGLPTLYPSIGNWQLPCRSHYWISDGEVHWSYQWTQNQIDAGADSEKERRKDYFERIDQKKNRPSILASLWNWIKGEDL
jgi:hypothetical protein